MKENDIIRKLVKQHGEKDILDWAAKENVKPTYNAALYWLSEVKKVTGEIRL